MLCLFASRSPLLAVEEVKQVPLSCQSIQLAIITPPFRCFCVHNSLFSNLLLLLLLLARVKD